MKRENFRVVTYNIHKCRGLDGRVQPRRIAKVLKEVNADIIALQEVVNIQGKKRERHQSVFIANELEFYHKSGKSRKYKEGEYGNTTLSRFPILGSGRYDISIAGKEPRECLRIDIQFEGHLLHVFNVHLGTGLLERREQAKKLVHEDVLLDPKLEGTRIVLGDFNEWTRGVTTKLLATHFQSVKISKNLPFLKTYPGFFPFLHLDHIYFDRGLKLDSVTIHKSRAALMASDHLPIMADFTLA
ncbi:MAG TPA: endonuclease/exonuclease/phosphatase family protein [Acidobacteriota bacterium]